MTKEEYKAEQLKNALRKAITALELGKGKREREMDAK
jgi:hypothetical protein